MNIKLLIAPVIVLLASIIWYFKDPDNFETIYTIIAGITSFIPFLLKKEKNENTQPQPLNNAIIQNSNNNTITQTVIQNQGQKISFTEHDFVPTDDRGYKLLIPHNFNYPKVEVYKDNQVIITSVKQLDGTVEIGSNMIFNGYVTLN